MVLKRIRAKKLSIYLSIYLLNKNLEKLPNKNQIFIWTLEMVFVYLFCFVWVMESLLVLVFVVSKHIGVGPEVRLNPPIKRIADKKIKNK